jgi:hypothetical protein
MTTEAKKTINPDTACWLAGQIDAVFALTGAVRLLLDVHCPAAANEMQGAVYAFRKANKEIAKATRVWCNVGEQPRKIVPA